MPLDLQGLSVQRIAMHHIPKRNPDKLPGIPIHAQRLTDLPQTGKDAFRLRITEALGKSSHGIELTLVDFLGESFLQRGSKLMYMSDADFLEESKFFADRLAAIQAKLDLAASKLIIVDGRIGANQNRFLAAIKADLQDGFADDDDHGATHLKNLFLTPTQRLYKIGLLQEVISAQPNEDGLRNEENYRMHLFDHLVTSQETRSAAHYFYRELLGSDIIYSGKKITRDFYDLTTTFINSSPISQDSKIDYFEALRTELRSNRANVHVETFIVNNFDPELHQPFLDFLEQSNFGHGAFPKDLEFIKSRLKRRQRMKFSQGLEISAPADSLHNLVTVRESTAQRTILEINAVIERQE